jgi:hypothetical protein
MANSTKQPPKRKKLAQMPDRGGSVAVEEPPEPPQMPETPFDPEPQAAEPPIHHPPPAPPAQPRPQPRPKGDFFETVRRVAKEDWGTRIFLYLYCFEPICDEKLSGEKKYLNRYAQPVLDEQAVMIDYGSGKYRFTLTNRKPDGSTEKGPPIESYDFEIYNPKFPPKLPRKVWKNDPRNARWEALLPKEEPPGPPPSTIDPMAAFDTFLNIQDRVQERMTPATPPAPAIAAAPDPFDTAKKIMDMRANDPMVTLLMARMEAQDKAMDAARAREFELQQRLIDAKTAQPPTRGLAEQFIELLPLFEKLEPVKKFFTNGTAPAADIGDTVRRSSKMGGLEFLSTVLPKVFESPLANAFATKLMQQPSEPAAMNGNGHRPAVQPAVDPFQRFINDIATPAMLEYFTAEATGDALADWIYSVFPRECLRLQKFTHPMIPGLVGAPAIVQGYKNTPAVWVRIGDHKEAEFVVFINQFCDWKPEPEDEDDGTIEATASPVDEDGWSTPSSSPDREEAPV